jgi:hypothetical protein
MSVRTLRLGATLGLSGKHTSMPQTKMGISDILELTWDNAQNRAIWLASVSEFFQEAIQEGHHPEVVWKIPASEKDPAVWTFYLKAKEGDPRILLARPEAGEYVATVALRTDDWLRLFEAFKAGNIDRIALSKFVSLDRLSNLDLLFVL